MNFAQLRQLSLRLDGQREGKMKYLNPKLAPERSTLLPLTSHSRAFSPIAKISLSFSEKIFQSSSVMVPSRPDT